MIFSNFMKNYILTDLWRVFRCLNNIKTFDITSSNACGDI